MIELAPCGLQSYYTSLEQESEMALEETETDFLHLKYEDLHV